jgi:hypothetical protein
MVQLMAVRQILPNMYLIALIMGCPCIIVWLNSISWCFFFQGHCEIKREAGFLHILDYAWCKTWCLLFNQRNRIFMWYSFSVTGQCQNLCVTTQKLYSFLIKIYRTFGYTWKWVRAVLSCKTIERNRWAFRIHVNWFLHASICRIMLNCSLCLWWTTLTLSGY